MINDLKNSIDFFIRNNTKFSRKNFVELNPEHVERNKKENLYTKDVLEQVFTKIKKSNMNILDIGCKNWFYAKGEYDYFESFCEDFCLDGVELDAYRLYSNLYSRYETAKFYIKDLKNVNYIVGNLLSINKKYDYIIWFLPFVFEEPLKYWGLPKKFFDPVNLLVHAYGLLEVGGQMLIVNQGLDEFEEQKRLLNNIGIPYDSIGLINSQFFQYKFDRYRFIFVN